MLGSSYHLVSKSSALAPGTSSSAWVSRVSPFRLVRVVRLSPCCARRVSVIFNWSVRIEPPLSLWSSRRCVLCFGCSALVAYGRGRVLVCAWWPSSRSCDRSRPTSSAYPCRVVSFPAVIALRCPYPYVVRLAHCPPLSLTALRSSVIVAVSALAPVLPSVIAAFFPVVLTVIPCRRWCARRPVVALVRSALRDRFERLLTCPTESSKVLPWSVYHRCRRALVDPRIID